MSPSHEPPVRPQGRYYADLHIHSRFSRATSKAITPESLDSWARRKGLALIGTGDLTHPGWLSELEAKLLPDDEGFYRLKENSQGTRFTPTGEISAIYKQDGRVRKVHLVTLFPDLPAARRFSQALASRGNVHSDGRPILGLSARDLLEIALTADPAALVIPAHIWTPWFSLFGHKSGFDRLEDCFQDLTSHITALETGLSSDPAMNRLVSALDRYHLVSSSDAHSPDKLGREATVLAGPPNRARLWAALTTGEGLVGTVEFFPEEGKYHLDGHAHCGPALTPEQTRELKGLCPVCGRPLTIGVLSRVLELADRSEPGPRLPDWHILPLPELMGQVLGQGAATQAVTQACDRLLAKWPSEFEILMETDLAEIKQEAGPLVALGVERARNGEVSAQGGYDGVFGTIEVISERDREEAQGQNFLFSPPPRKRGRPPRSAQAPPAPAPAAPASVTVIRRKKEPLSLLTDLSQEQKATVSSEAHSLAIVAGPGSGKTLCLIRRAAYQARRLTLPPEKVLLTTYTKKAAETLSERLLDPQLGLTTPELMTAKTLHALALGLIKKSRPDWDLVPEPFLDQILRTQAAPVSLAPKRLAQAISYWKNTGSLPRSVAEIEGLLSLIQGYQAALAERHYWDFDDLIIEATREPGGDWALVLADEIQDFSAIQRDFLLHLAQNAPLTVIGDPDQSVYGFRGALTTIFEDLRDRRPDLETLELTANFRSTSHICQLAEAARPGPKAGQKTRRCAFPGRSKKIARLTFPSPREEARFVARRLREHLGVLDLGSEGRASREAETIAELTMGETAIIFRWRAQAAELIQALDEEGLAWQMAGEEEITSADGLDLKADKINLLTIHAAKGLEFRLVFLVGLEEGLFPETREEPSQALDEREEARLFYVALTRARERLYLTRAVRRSHYGRLLPGNPSPFWAPLDRFCLDRFISRPRGESSATLF
ncbi:MAG: UvrD-helicase domain-containing protein [Deltaproteobacteria bacterium]|jgi:DNA helicase-2/ATP-dependent DNA helicase PcrA|nr:UvrD-helicase domain-containing protein [Deltaproteobacteria bacterium]